jgi:hypothetical protein
MHAKYYQAYLTEQFDPGIKGKKLIKPVQTSFSPHSKKPVFQGKWMTADAWSEVIVRHYKLSDITSFKWQSTS